MRSFVAAALGLLLSATLCRFAAAHDQWDDGSPVPGWVKAQCCGVADAHHLTPDQVHVTPDGYRVDVYTRAIAQSRRLPSPDGSWWVFYRTYGDGTQSTVYCFFGPDSGS